MVPLPQVDFWNLEAEGVPGEYQHGSVSLAVEPLQCIITCPGAPDLDEGPPVDDPNRHLQCRMIRWTIRCSHCGHHRSPDRSRHPETLMKSGILVIRNTIHDGR